MRAFFKIDDDFSLVPHDEAAQKYIARRKPETIILAEIRMSRNYEFHKKMFALFQAVADNLPEQPEIEFKGEMIRPEFGVESVRKYLTVMTGYYHVVGYPNGSVRTEAKSLSYDSMNQLEFEDCYSKTIDAALKLMGQKWTGADLERVTNEIMRFT